MLKSPTKPLRYSGAGKPVKGIKHVKTIPISKIALVVEWVFLSLNVNARKLANRRKEEKIPILIFSYLQRIKKM